MAAALVVLLVLLAAVLAWRGGSNGLFGSGRTSSLGEVLKNPLSIFAERSPGDRADGALFASKRRVSPFELVMGTGRERTPSASEAAAPTGAGPLQSPESLLAPAEGPPLVAGIVPSTIPEGAILGPPGGPSLGTGNPGFFIPVGSPPGSTVPPTTPPVSPPGCCTPVTPPVLPAIPEPATWVTLILGFFMVGGVLRTRPKPGTTRYAN